MPLNEDGMPSRQCFVIRVDTEEEVGNARAVLMEVMLVCDTSHLPSRTLYAAAETV